MDEEAYRELARRVASSVAVVTVLPSRGSELDGFTATSFLMLSISPPLIAISASNETSAAKMLRESRAFVLNLLAVSQVDVASAFALQQADREGVFQRFSWKPDAEGAPV